MLKDSIKCGTNKLHQYSLLCLKEHWESMDLVLLTMNKSSFFFFTFNIPLGGTEFPYSMSYLATICLSSGIWSLELKKITIKHPFCSEEAYILVGDM